MLPACRTPAVEADDNRAVTAYDAPFLPVAAAQRDLSDAECIELDRLLAETPAPFEPMDIVMLDGYLCGLLAQPVPIEPAAWLRHVFDVNDRRLPDELLGSWHERAVALVLRRHQALNQALFEDGAFDPLIPDLDGDETAADGAEPLPGVAAVSRPLVGWVAGFHFAAGLFPALEELDDDEVGFALARIYRHLPAEDDEQREMHASLDAELPLASVDDAIDDLVAAVAEIADFTRDLRFQVETVRREAPKVGRNDPCPCGSGKKYKRCHGA